MVSVYYALHHSSQVAFRARNSPSASAAIAHDSNIQEKVKCIPVIERPLFGHHRLEPSGDIAIFPGIGHGRVRVQQWQYERRVDSDQRIARNRL